MTSVHWHERSLDLCMMADRKCHEESDTETRDLLHLRSGWFTWWVVVSVAVFGFRIIFRVIPFLRFRKYWLWDTRVVHWSSLMPRGQAALGICVCDSSLLRLTRRIYLCSYSTISLFMYFCVRRPAGFAHTLRSCANTKIPCFLPRISPFSEFNVISLSCSWRRNGTFAIFQGLTHPLTHEIRKVVGCPHKI